mmetsp:Transcript_892/g.1426  ORF Transcript_892/g.1426 Transcript_892/m.1426 type:complete len:80 (-) Transcript_892:509-748(-)
MPSSLKTEKIQSLLTITYLNIGHSSGILWLTLEFVVPSIVAVHMGCSYLLYVVMYSIVFTGCLQRFGISSMKCMVVVRT